MRSPRRSFLAGWPFLFVLPGAVVKAAASRSLEQRLLAELENLEIADTHEHFFDEQDRVAQQVDFFALVQAAYTGSDLVSAGMPPESLRVLRNEKAPEMERWRAFEPYWKLVRFTGYGQAVRLAVHDLYGGKEVSAATIHEINEAIRARNKPGLYQYILRERARIRFYVLDDSCGGCIKTHGTKESFEPFILARRFDKFIVPATPQDIKELEGMTGVSITTLADLKLAVEKSFEQNIGEGMRAVKVALAYYRQLRFEEADKADAEGDFEALMHQ